MQPRPDRINRHPERARHELSDLYAVLDAGHHMGTLSTVVDGLPWVVPMIYGREKNRLLFHGSVAAGALRQVADGAPAALCVTHLDSWVYGHTLFNSSANYRSAVVHGDLIRLSGTEAAEALLNNAGLCHSLYGYPTVSLKQATQWVAEWVGGGGRQLGKATKFQTRDGRF